jgi:sigma-B regulation protein RsbU (phosphoserine phosphatase)
LLIPESESATFVTVFFGVLNIRSGELQFSNGAQNSPYLMRASGEVEQLPLTDGSILGKFIHLDYDTRKVRLQPGDTLFLYTDGVSEAMDAENNQYGDERLKSYLETVVGSDIEAIVKGNMGDLKKHTGEAPQSDDITLLALRYNGGV